MMKINFTLVVLMFAITTFAQVQKVVSECTVVYELSQQSTSDAAKSMEGATKTLYLKGGKSRSDLVSSNYTLTTFTDSKTDTTVVLRELGAAKYMSYLSQQKKDQQNKKFEGVTFTKTANTKVILGYDCVEAVAKLKDGSTYSVFYAPSIIPANRDYEFQFKEIPGFVLEYEAESEDGKTKMKYSAVKISLTPVPASRFDLPKSGYRIL